MGVGYINLESGGRDYSLTLYEAKELYYTLRDIFDDNFRPQRMEGDYAAFANDED